MNETIDVRPAGMEDLETLVQFNANLASETEALVLDRDRLRAGVRAVLADDRLGFYLVATAGDRVIGCVMVTFEWSDWRNGMFWWIQSVYVDVAFRRQGVFRLLHEQVRQLAAEQNVCGFRLYVEQDNQRAMQTYTKLGMQPTPYKMYQAGRERS